MYYTPDTLTRTLVDWAIRDPMERVFEPSFGSCGFLAAARDRLANLGSTRPGDRLYGCEIDRDVADRSLKAVLGAAVDNGRFVPVDFLALTLDDFGGVPFEVALGNPPYVSHHNLSRTQRASAARWTACTQTTLPATASLWAHFVLHALSFLRPGGRCAWILPRSFFHAGYADVVKERLKADFQLCAAVELRESCFKAQGASEGMVVVVGDGFRNGPAERMGYAEATDERHLSELLVRLAADKRSYTRLAPGTGQGPAREVLDRVWSRVDVRSLGALAEVKIGAVTGANGYFLFSERERRKFGLAKTYLVRAMTNASATNGLILTDDDLVSAGWDLPIWLLDTGLGSRALRTKGSALRRYLARIPRTLRRRNATFRKRKPWHRVQLVPVPAAFLTYMSSSGPRLLLNRCGAIPTNSVHAIYFRQGLSMRRTAAVALALISSVGQLSAELVGRSLSGGLLKHEPSDARRIGLPFPSSWGKAVSVLGQADRLLRSGAAEQATQLADEFVLSDMGSRARRQLVGDVTRELGQLRDRRQRITARS